MLADEILCGQGKPWIFKAGSSPGGESDVGPQPSAALNKDGRTLEPACPSLVTLSGCHHPYGTG